VSDNLPYEWHDTPNIHLCTITDFERFCAGRAVKILECKVLTRSKPVSLLPNLLGSLAHLQWTESPRHHGVLKALPYRLLSLGKRKQHQCHFSLTITSR
jgi:hypothetical protein